MPPFTFSTRDLNGGPRVITLAGELDMYSAGMELTGLLASCVECRCDVLVDLSDLEFIDSMGIAALLRLRSELAAADHRLVLVAPGDRVSRVIEMTGLSGTFAVAPAVEDALASL
jgi:anti-anti-sigma factor